jgi:Ca2+-binding RTX toxin-like protein
MPTFTGTADADTLNGSAGDDLLRGLGSSDRIVTGDGQDTVEGGDGNDEVNGSLDNPATGAYSFFAVSGRKLISGGAGNDFLLGGSDADTLQGDSGNDLLYGEGGPDSLHGGDGDDELYGGEGDDLLEGDPGADFFITGNGRDTVNAGPGDDQINGSYAIPASGAYDFYPSSGAKVLHGDAGNDFVLGSSDGDALFGDDGDDALFGREGADRLDGGAGNDRLDGGPGNDTLISGTGVDELEGGPGDDLYLLGSPFANIYDESGVDTAVQLVDHLKVGGEIEQVLLGDNVQPLPYWIDALLPNASAGMAFATLLGTPAVMRYCFPAGLPSYDQDPENALGHQPFSATQAARARDALAYVASICGLSFQETTNPAQTRTITFANNRQSSSAGYALYPSSDWTGSDVFLDVDSPGNDKLAEGSYAALTLIHEIGHALGLKHPFSAAGADGEVADGPYLAEGEDATAWTVMSYNDDARQYTLRMSPLDVAALQYLYGPNPSARASNDVYRVDPSAPNFIWDGAGTDRIDASALTQRITLDLRPGAWGYVGATQAASITSPGQITVNFGSLIEHVTGTAHADWLIGNDVDNRLEGGAGNDTLEGGTGHDTLDGGAGQDTVRVRGAFADFSLMRDASLTSVTLAALKGNLGRDTLIGIERIVFNDGVVPLGATGVFTFQLDLTAPTLLSTQPTEGAVGVPVGSALTLRLSEELQRGAGTVTLKTSDGQVVEQFGADSLHFRLQGDTLVLNPGANLGIFTRYSVELSAGAVQDLAGNALAVPASVSFRTATLDGLYHFFVVAFAAAPGVTYMGQLAEAVNYGLPLQQIVEIFTTKPQFTGVYPTTMSNRELASTLVNNIVKTSATEAARIEAINNIETVLSPEIGWSRGKMLYTVFGNLASKAQTDPVWGGTAQQFQKQLAVARHFTEEMGVATENLATLRGVIDSVTPDTDVSTVDKIVQIIGTVPPGG